MAIKQVKNVAGIPCEELDAWALCHKAGDTVYFDHDSKGSWEVLETVRKAYLTFKRD